MRKRALALYLSCACLLFAGKNFRFFSGMYHVKPYGEAAYPADTDLLTASTGGRSYEIPVVKSTNSAYENIAVSRVTSYVNIREQANTTSTIVGKIYNNCAATILSTVDGEGGKWYQIESGTVKGYIKAQYFITGSEAEAIARQIGTSFAKVSSTTALRLREQPNLDSRVLELLSPQAEYEVIGEEGNFAKIAVDTDLTGYVSKDFINIRVEFKKAVSLEEEAAKNMETQRLRQEADAAIKMLEDTKIAEAQRQSSSTAAPPVETKAPDTTYSGMIEANPSGVAAEEAAARAAEAARKAAAEKAAAEKAGGGTNGSGASAPGGNIAVGPTGGFTAGPGGSAGSPVASATRSAIIAYARQFLGNPYVYGGTSLTNGADCSGFTQSIFAHFGIETGRSSRDQAVKGREIAVSSVRPGDLLFYGSDNYINHVALYIGDGQVIHASTERTGIIISPSNYRTPCKAVSFLD